ncbi:MAG: hypothetical protein IPH37_18505 [Burkholderiales bacterium]|nr:hypothetical protein [Burkholderiales bacterium]
MKGVYWAWGAVLGDLAVFMGPLPHATSDAAFVQLWLLHAGSCAILATSSLVLMPSKNRATLHWTWLLLFCFAAIAPVLGSLCILLISYTTLRQALDVHNHAKPQTVALPEFEARSQQTSRAGQGAIRSRLTAQVPSNVRMQSLLTLQAVPSRVANPILESLLGDETDDVRLIAFGMLDAEEKKLSVHIHQEQKNLKPHCPVGRGTTACAIGGTAPGADLRRTGPRWIENAQPEPGLEIPGHGVGHGRAACLRHLFSERPHPACARRNTAGP